ncbi:hypothetical protein DAETH_48030 (plasmid) [Deinococcus aetherius]|uniref:Uncharacterized protein n=1 Tax=Deinococcus aetherius TaxID=200252 RepID=A0ABM8ALW0_9DEIO|nr:hypothetical protein [Deinococcus aetherius]BDP44834.1 hypothetical protein DAETH_48030 [Deinococcus aetherius]
MTSKPADPNEQLLALNERMNALELEFQGVRRELAERLEGLPVEEARALLREVRGALAQVREALARPAPVPDLAPLQSRVDEALEGLETRERQLVARLADTAADLEARAERAVKALSVLRRQT